MSLFTDRRHAGRILASKLGYYAGRPDVIVLGLPRGGVPVGFEVARALGAPLDVLVVRKLGVPGHEELAMGAVASGALCILHVELLAPLGISHEDVVRIVRKERLEVGRRERAYRGERPPLDVTGCTVVLVDDGLATGSSMRAAIQSVRKQAPARIVLAVPVAAPETCRDLSAEVDEVVCAATPQPFYAVGLWYEDFSQTTDREVSELLAAATREQEQRQSAPMAGARAS